LVLAPSGAIGMRTSVGITASARRLPRLLVGDLELILVGQPDLLRLDLEIEARLGRPKVVVVSRWQREDRGIARSNGTQNLVSRINRILRFSGRDAIDGTVVAEGAEPHEP